MEPIFIPSESGNAFHLIGLAQFGGVGGMRDHGALESAWTAAENVYRYGSGDICQIAAAYTFHIAPNHPFIDGNKRVALATAATFLKWNGCEDRSQDTVLYDMMTGIDSRRTDKQAIAEILQIQFPSTGVYR